ncbi:hypothetical protein GN956_G8220 [Arapaima gigas]
MSLQGSQTRMDRIWVQDFFWITRVRRKLQWLIPFPGDSSAISARAVGVLEINLGARQEPPTATGHMSPQQNAEQGWAANGTWITSA